MKIVTVIGARPQFIKAAPVSRAFQACSDIREVLVHTGQHYDNNMSSVFFEDMQIPKPEYMLGIGSHNHGAQTGKMLEAIENILLEERPDWMLVYGDTNSTLAGALAASKLHIPVAHVEAGLRSYNRAMPEEINRILTDQLSDLFFTPTDTATAILQKEGVAPERIHQVGDVMYDAALYFSQHAQSHSQVLKTLGLTQGQYVLATLHRAENTNNKEQLEAIIQGLSLLAKEIPVVLPLHPRTEKIMADSGLLNEAKENLNILPPQGYFDILELEKHAAMIATDSGGMQKEGFFFGVPCAILRTETEWRELVDLGWNDLIDLSNKDTIFDGLKARLHAKKGSPATPYGDGEAAQKMAAALMQTSKNNYATL